MTNLTPLREFVTSFTRLLDAADGDEARILREGKPLLARRVSSPPWSACPW
jgi:hypothetical protein